MVFPYINMNPPQVYMCSPSRTPHPPPSLDHPSGSSQCTSPKHPVSCIELGLSHKVLSFIHLSRELLFIFFLSSVSHPHFLCFLTDDTFANCISLSSLWDAFFLFSQLLAVKQLLEPWLLLMSPVDSSQPLSAMGDITARCVTCSLSLSRGKLYFYQAFSFYGLSHTCPGHASIHMKDSLFYYYYYFYSLNAASSFLHIP